MLSSLSSVHFHMQLTWIRTNIKPESQYIQPFTRVDKTYLEGIFDHTEHGLLLCHILGNMRKIKSSFMILGGPYSWFKDTLSSPIQQAQLINEWWIWIFIYFPILRMQWSMMALPYLCLSEDSHLYQTIVQNSLLVQLKVSHFLKLLEKCIST